MGRKEGAGGGGAQVNTYGEERKGMGRRCPGEYIWGGGGGARVNTYGEEVPR